MPTLTAWLSGAGAPPPRMALPDYVLGKFPEAERADLPKVIDMAMAAAECWLESGMEQAMTIYNGLSIYPEELPSPS